MPRPIPPNLLADLGRSLQDAVALHRQGRLPEAEKIYARILKANPDHFDALQLSAQINMQRGKHGEAYRLMTAAVAINPQSADARVNLGLVLRALKREADALASFDQALALAPDNVEALGNRGDMLLGLKRSQEALACFERILTLAPGHLGARASRGTALAELERYTEALADFDAVLAAAPGNAMAHYNCGNVLAALGRPAEAIAAFDRALAAVPQHAAAWNNRGLALQALNRHAEALASYGHAIAARADYADAHFNRSLALLATGDYTRGFAEFEWRWKRTGMTDLRRRFGRPLWLGEYPLQHKTILLHAEQGLGDSIQFARYVPLLVRAGAKVVLEVQSELVELLARLDGASRVVASGEALPPFDLHCPLASLPLALKTEPGAVPAEIPYLRADDARIEKWRPRLERLAAPRIALAWSGRAAHVNDRNRSIALSRLTPLLELAGARFVSIQRELRQEDGEALAGDARLTHLGGKLADFADTAAVVALSDLVIAVDTSVVHLAGAMGRPVWVLLPYSPDWRWTLQGEATPWYPTVRLFRQTSIGDWDGVIERIRAAAIKFCAPATAR